MSVKQYGSWKSPISSALVTESSVSFQEMHVDLANGFSDDVYWCESRADEGGRNVICSKNLNKPDITEWTPKEFNVRTLVHEYGGGSFCVYNQTVYFSNFSDQRLYRQKGCNDKPEPVTPSDSNWRYADGCFHEKNQRLYCVREDHSGVVSKNLKEPENTVVVINPETEQQHVLASGSDFYSSPRVSPDGKKIAWVQWSHPNMPWDSTELMIADLESGGDKITAGTAKKIAGGTDISLIHPRWTPSGELLYLGDQTDWWNIYHIKSEENHENLMPVSKEIGGPHWVFADYKYDIDPSGSGAVILSCGSEIGILDMKTKSFQVIDTGFSSHSLLQMSSSGKHVYCVAGSPTKFRQVIYIDVESKKVNVIKESKVLSLDNGYFSIPKKISWETPLTEGVAKETSHGYLYLPQNKDFIAPEGTLPPLLVQCHGGPTGSTSDVLSLRMQYFTSRGFAVLDVDYRGSTGYGKKYRHKLRKSWGILDIEDASSGAMYLAKNNYVDGSKLCIDGGSAGGYTTLACLAFTDVFKAGASHYGVADLAVLAAETHKFESRYLDNLIAPYTPENMHIFDARSPIKHVDQINCAVSFFQGDEDKIVPPNQAEMMFDSVKEKGLPCALVMFKGEQHGFRKAENIQKALDGEFYFFGKVLGYEPADGEIELEIFNLENANITQQQSKQ